MQFKQCAEYAKRELHLDDEYSFLEYEDKGFSGYYSDRTDFQRMLHDIEMGKIRTVVCSNNTNTASGVQRYLSKYSP